MRIESLKACGGLFDIARHEPLYQVRPQDNLVSWRKRSWPTDPRNKAWRTAQVAEQNGGWDKAQSFFRLSSGPRNGPLYWRTGDRRIRLPYPASRLCGRRHAAGWGCFLTGKNFNAATYQVVGNYITNGFINACDAH